MKTCIVTGASGGIGGEIAIALAKQGYFVFLQGRNAEKLNKVKAQIGENSELVVGDLNKPSDRERIIKLLASGENFSLLVNAAGISHFSAFDKTDEHLINQVITTNLITPMLFIQELIQNKNQENNHDRISIINIGSAFGYIGYPGYAAYSASKFGLRGLTESLRREFADTRFKFAYFAPRATQTEINTSQVNELNKALGNSVDSPRHVAALFIKFLKKHSDEATVGWPEKLFVKINALLPTLVDNAIKSKLPVIKQHMGA